MAAKKRRKKAKKAATKRRRSTARASTAKRGSRRVAVSMKDLKKLMGGGTKRRKSGGKRSHSRDDFFESAFSFEEGRGRPSFTGGAGMSALERKYLSEVNSSARALEKLKEKDEAEKRRLKDIERMKTYEKLSREQLDDLRAERGAKIAAREARYRLAVAKHKDLINRKIDELKDVGASPEIVKMAKELSFVRKTG